MKTLLFIVQISKENIVILEVECFIIKLSYFPARLLFHCIKIAPADTVYYKIKMVLIII